MFLPSKSLPAVIGIKMSAFSSDESAVMLLLERVSEAQRIAAMELRESEVARKDRKRNGGADDEGDEETETGSRQIAAGLGGASSRGRGGSRGGRGGAGGRGGRGGGRGGGG